MRFYVMERRPARAHAIELLVFVLLLVPALALSLVVTQVTEGPFWLVATATILRDVSLVALVIYFVWRNGEPLSRIGLGGGRLGREALLGVALFIPVTAAAGAIERAASALGLSGARAPAALIPAHGAQTVLAVVLVSVVAVSEETIFRGYLLYRLREVLGNTPMAVVLSSGIFAIGHGYEGSAGMITVLFLGVVYALVLLWRGNLAAPMVMHFCQDLVAIVLAPFLFGRG